MTDDDRKISVLMVADVRLYREGLAAAIGNRSHLALVAACSNRAEALIQARALRPDVIVVDMAMRDGLEFIREVRDGQVLAKILVFAVDEATSDVMRCAEAGASGYVTSDASVDELVMAIERIDREELVCSPRVAAQLFVRMGQHTTQWSSPQGTRMLTIRERQVLELIRDGYSNKEIGQRLNIAEPTVKNHVHNLLEKLNVPTRARAASAASRDTSRRASA
jgi:two-component system, NarL family, nitrate/nitrite response regulator NarL